jgi:hypothetical protein
MAAVVIWNRPQQTVGFQQSILVGLFYGVCADHLGHPWNARTLGDQSVQWKRKYVFEVQITEIAGRQKMRDIWPCIEENSKRRRFTHVCFLSCSSYSCPGPNDAPPDESTDDIVPRNVGSIVYCSKFFTEFRIHRLWHVENVWLYIRRLISVKTCTESCFKSC